MNISAPRRIRATVAAIVALFLVIGVTLTSSPGTAHADDTPVRYPVQMSLAHAPSVTSGMELHVIITLTSPAATAPTGTVTVHVNGTPHTMNLFASVGGTESYASFSIRYGNVGTTTIAATYNGDEFHDAVGPKESSYSVTPEPARVTVNMPDELYLGEDVWFTARLTRTSTPFSPGSQVEMTADGVSSMTPLQFDRPDLGAYATLRIRPTALGDFDLRTNVIGSPNHVIQGSVHPYTVVSRPTFVAATATASGSVALLTATVTAPAREVAPIPSGRVDFYAGDDLIATGAPDAAGAVATVSSPLPDGNHTITARFSDVSQRFAASTSGPVQLRIGAITPSPEPSAEPTPEASATPEPTAEATATPTPEPTATPSTAPIAVPTSTTTPSTAPEPMPAITQYTASEAAPTTAAIPAALAATGGNGLGLGLLGIAAVLLIAGTTLRRRRA